MLAALALGLTVPGGIAFGLLWAGAGAVCFMEWSSIAAGRASAWQASLAALAFVALAIVALRPDALQHVPFPADFARSGLVLVAILGTATLIILFAAPKDRRLWIALGLAYCGTLPMALCLLRQSSFYGLAAVLFLFAVVWITDIAAYFVGRAFGGPKLFPRVSPKKTWSGFLGGTLGASIAGALMLAILGILIHWQHFALALLLSVASAMGDLFESAFKRRFGVKDSGRILPGHGGLLDRLDGFLAAALVAVLIGLLRDHDPAAGLLVW